MSGGWQGHLARVERWYKRSSNSHDEHDQIDFLYAFFESSFALRDWLIDTGAMSPQEIDSLFLKHVELRINRDVANSLKHHSITRPSQEQPPSIAAEYAPEYPTFGSDRRLIILSEGRKYEALALARRCLEIWHECLDTLSNNAPS